jgi:hypothetical protein
MAITRPYVGSATVSTTEFSLINGSTTSADLTSTGVWQPMVDFTNLDDGTVYQLKIKDRFTTGGPQVTIHSDYIAHAQGSAPGMAFPALNLGNGMDISLTLVTGSATIVAWQLWKTA